MAAAADVCRTISAGFHVLKPAQLFHRNPAAARRLSDVSRLWIISAARFSS
jgi:hypothetical protein